MAPSLGLSLLLGLGFGAPTGTGEEGAQLEPLHPLVFALPGFGFLVWIAVGTWWTASSSKYFGGLNTIYEHWIRITATNIFVLPGVVLLAIHSIKCFEPLHYDGPMYILQTGVDTKFVPAQRLQESGWIPEYYVHRAQVRVAFGSEWACSAEGGRWCETLARIYDCDFCSRSNAGYQKCPQGYSSDVLSCLQSSAFPDLVYWRDRIGWPTVYDDSFSFRKEVRPDDETQWPLGHFHGDCSTCAAFEADTYDDSLTYSRRLRLAAFILIGLGILIILVDLSFKKFSALRNADLSFKFIKAMKRNAYKTNPPLANAAVSSSDEDDEEIQIRRPPGHSFSFCSSSSTDDCDHAEDLEIRAEENVPKSNNTNPEHHEHIDDGGATKRRTPPHEDKNKEEEEEEWTDFDSGKKWADFPSWDNEEE